MLLSCIAVGGGSRGSSDATRLLILDVFPRASLDTMFTFNNEADVCNEFGDGPAECGVATDFFAGYEGSDADFLVARSSLGGARPRDQGAALNVGLSAFTRAPCNPTCSMSIVLDGYTITTNWIDWASATCSTRRRVDSPGRPQRRAAGPGEFHCQRRPWLRVLDRRRQRGVHHHIGREPSERRDHGVDLRDRRARPDADEPGQRNGRRRWGLHQFGSACRNPPTTAA